MTMEEKKQKKSIRVIAGLLFLALLIGFVLRAGQVLPPAIGGALSVALYGMFIAVVVPVAVKIRPVLWVAVLAALLSCMIYYIPLFSGISTGMSIIICTILASVIGAIFFPVIQEPEEKSKENEAKI